MIPPEADARVRGAHGRGAGHLRQAVRSGLPGAVHGRAAGAVAEGDARADPRDARITRRRVDYEYERAGTASIFMFTRAAGGLASGERACERKTKIDWASRDGARCWKADTPRAEKVILVCDNLNTHTKGAFYEAFEPSRARRVGPAAGVPPHAQARQLAEHRRERTEFADAAVRGRPALRRRRRRCAQETAAWSNDVNGHATRRRLANEDRRRADQTEKCLP